MTNLSTYIVESNPQLPDYASMNIGMFWQFANVQKFSYGTWDCIQFVGAFGKVNGYENHAEKYFGTYTDKKEAVKIIGTYGRTIAALFDYYLEVKHIDKLKFGDPCVCLVDGQHYSSIRQTSNAITVTENGLRTVNTLAIVKGYQY